MTNRHTIADVRRCPLDNGQPCDFTSLGSFIDKSGKVGEVSVIRCTRCGIGVSLPPLPDVAFLYDGRESQDFQPDARGLSHRIKDIAFRRQARALLRQLAHRPKAALDFGCGSGQFTRCLDDLLPCATVTGTDFHSEPPAELAGRDYFPIATASVHADAFDLVTAFHVLEHDDDPESLLNRIAALAAPGGTLVIEVPNIDCMWTRLLGQAWDAWYLPFHRIHFSRPALRALIDNAGLTIEQDIDICVPTMGRSLANAFGRPNSLPFLLAGIALHPLQWLGEALSGKPSAIRIIARKN
ncbi:hypothetical protein CDQ92_00700 [Sphingopyxis bauzanensis]|uniref:Methyltransferase type 12 n=1 Tax=Sphingopyxis bauzanensis TaxID=651663 RepID=A0A246K009_9SPHN|nr:class I SAM-dependent methyltransferase [Sphingopyxis bauzanensis]OWQ98768.1 hypothetical protein CDQ92_00700 [Sphingopyxis bauzanensis]GGJ58031.1 SAM-dependent methyltransferase [Sphingopyxis bauzanensis]